MSKLYTEEDCIRKADQEMEMASLAYWDGDMDDYNRRLKEAEVWTKRAKEVAIEDS